MKSKQTIAFKCNFIRSLFSQPPTQWVECLEDMDVDIFDYNILLMPFEAEGHTSLFAIVGAKYIRDYTKIGFGKNRPCILHFDPNGNFLSKHDHRQVADKLRSWLNHLWRKKNDYHALCMPFQKRTMPLCRPLGTLVCFLYVPLSIFLNFHRYCSI